VVCHIPIYETSRFLKNECQDAGPTWVTWNIFWESHKIINLVLGLTLGGSFFVVLKL